MKYVVLVQNTETLELDLFGPYDTQREAELERNAYVRHMDVRTGFLDVYSVWVRPIRTKDQSISFHMSFYNMWMRLDNWARSLTNPYELDK